MDGINDQNNNGAVHNLQEEVQPNVERRRINRPGPEEGEQEEEEGVTYMECRRNVSLAAGLYTVDGCSEFLRVAVGDQNSMLCAACGCHRNFHRKVLLAYLMDPATYLFLINNAPPVRPMPQPQPQPQPHLQPPPLPLLPCEVPPEIVDAESEIEEEEEEEENDEDEEEEEDDEDEDEDEEDDYEEEEESEEERSELDSESDEEIESAYREEKDSKQN